MQQKYRENIPVESVLEVWVDPNIESADFSSFFMFSDTIQEALENKIQINATSEDEPAQKVLGDSDSYTAIFSLLKAAGETQAIKIYFRIVRIDGDGKKYIVRKKDSFTFSSNYEEAILFLYMQEGDDA
jgi:hypothetical protein